MIATNRVVISECPPRSYRALLLHPVVWSHMGRAQGGSRMLHLKSGLASQQPLDLDGDLLHPGGGVAGRDQT